MTACWSLLNRLPAVIRGHLAWGFLSVGGLSSRDDHPEWRLEDWET